jgi:hypothetical protein
MSSPQVQDLVTKMQQGAISKTQLYDELSNMFAVQSGTATSGTPTTTTTAAAATVATPTQSSTTTADRLAAVTALLAEQQRKAVPRDLDAVSRSALSAHEPFANNNTAPPTSPAPAASSNTLPSTPPFTPAASSHADLATLSPSSLLKSLRAEIGDAMQSLNNVVVAPPPTMAPLSSASVSASSSAAATPAATTTTSSSSSSSSSSTSTVRTRRGAGRRADGVAPVATTTTYARERSVSRSRSQSGDGNTLARTLRNGTYDMYAYEYDDDDDDDGGDLDGPGEKGAAVSDVVSDYGSGDDEAANESDFDRFLSGNASFASLTSVASKSKSNGGGGSQKVQVRAKQVSARAKSGGGVVGNRRAPRAWSGRVMDSSGGVQRTTNANGKGSSGGEKQAKSKMRGASSSGGGGGVRSCGITGASGGRRVGVVSAGGGAVAQRLRKERARKQKSVAAQRSGAGGNDDGDGDDPECTFAPVIHDLPAFYNVAGDDALGRRQTRGASTRDDDDDDDGGGGGDGSATAARPLNNAAFFERSTRWQQKQDAMRARQAAEDELRELDECTFTPNVYPLRNVAATPLFDADGEPLDGGGSDGHAGGLRYELSREQVRRASEYNVTLLLVCCFPCTHAKYFKSHVYTNATEHSPAAATQTAAAHACRAASRADTPRACGAATSRLHVYTAAERQLTGAGGEWAAPRARASQRCRQRRLLQRRRRRLR